MKQLLLSILMLAFVARESSAQWTNFVFDNPAAFGVHDDSLFASQQGGDLYRYTPTGPHNWVIADTGMTLASSISITGFGSIGSYFLAAANSDIGGGAYRSSNNGSFWVATNAPQTNSFITTGGFIYSGGGSGVERSSDSGMDWTSFSTSPHGVNALAVLDTTIFAATGSGIFRSNDGGMNWKATSMTTSTDAVAVVGSIIVAGTHDAGMFRSTDGGTDWVSDTTGLFNHYVNSLVTDGKNLFAGTGLTGNGHSTSGSGVFLSKDSGLTWDTVNAGIPQSFPDKYLNITTLFVYDTILIAGTWDDAGVYSKSFARPISDMVKKDMTSGVVQQGPKSALTISAYPNPLSNSATIAYSLPESGFVTIMISDALGRTISVPVSGYEDAGAHQFNFDASAIAPGMYWCRLTAGDRVQITKLVIER